MPFTARSSMYSVSQRAMWALTTLATLCFIATAVLPQLARAENELVTITPVVIDEKAKVRDILKKSITIKNIGDRKLNIYPAVNDVHPDEGEEDFVAAQDSLDRAASLANWIELSRGVIDLSPGEEKVIPFVVRVNLNALPGTYHANISFTEGGSRAGSNKVASLMVNLEVQSEVKEIMQLNKFFTDNVFFSGDDVLFNFQVENIGNQELSPTGEIRVYNRKGEEVASIDVNKEGKAVSPDQVAQLASVWSAAHGFGKYKAFLNVDYGKSQAASVQDTVFFWIIPWQQLLGLFVAGVIAVIGLALYYHRWIEERAYALAHGGHAPAPAPAVPAATPKPARSWKLPSLPRPSFNAFAAISALVPKRNRVVAHVPAPVAPEPAVLPVAAPVVAPVVESAVVPPAEPAASVPVAPAHSKTRPLREAFADVEEVAMRPVARPRPEQGGTIDLKQLCKKPAEQADHHGGHVINLKRTK
ncbi:MAG: hypothetical protein KBE09_03525 [Candidatus Pacebacteria bacterium]|nr:hypothetical protein [Candidatus Paceibacterota bacterium]